MYAVAKVMKVPACYKSVSAVIARTRNNEDSRVRARRKLGYDRLSDAEPC